MVNIEQLNNSYIKVDCEPSIAQELSDFFTFEVPGAQFSPQYRNKYWDGKIRLFNLKNNQIYAGLYRHVEEFCRLNDYPCTTNLIDSKLADPKVDFTTKLKLPFEPRDYQLLGFMHALSKQRCVLISPTASGKSLMIYMIMSWLLANGKKRGLLIVPTVSLVEQMTGDFKSYGLNTDKYVQKIYAGFDKQPNMPITISTWQSIYEMPKKYFSQFDFVIGDEAHTFKAKSLTDIMTKLVNCDYRIGTTGTLDGTKVNKLVLEGLFGPVKKIVSTKELMDQKHLADFQINALVLKYPQEVCKTVKGISYQEEIDFLVSNETRNNYIRDLAIGLTGNTLILYTYVEKHGKVLFDIIDKIRHNRKVFFVCGETDVLDREQVRHITEKENDAIIVASYGTFSTGINIRNLHNIIFASPTKSRVRSLQSIGRGLRLGDNKEKAFLYDIADDLRYGSYTNFTLKHYEERMKMYSEEKFKVKIQNVSL
jgi:superfamily II DNA or RNA helicase